MTIRTCNQSLNELEADALGLLAGDYIQLSLTDTGCGMDKQTQDNIFDPFYTTKGDQGTGLGLSQVFGFVEHAGGTIKVYSELGHGSQFILYLPRHLDFKSKFTTETSAIREITTGDETILIVDDEDALRKLCAQQFSKQGYQTFCAEDSFEALKILEKEHIDLMLSDVIMPGMDGYQLASIVQEKYPDVKIQMASGFNDERHKGLVDMSLYSNLLHKPYNSHALFQSIRQLLDS